jgi:hypothetical protein
MIDFGSFRTPDKKNRPADPREIFKRRPSGEGAANDLWQGQAEALEKWFVGDQQETLILLNTGAGKTIIGLLIAQSYVNQGVPNVLYACSTIDLVYQTAREARKLGLQVSCRVGSRFDNELFNQGKVFCITTYSAILNARTFFKGQSKPGAIIFDDAHVANRIIRESFTIQIRKAERDSLFKEIIELLRPVFGDAHQKIEFQAALRDEGAGSALLVPPCGLFDISDNVASVLDREISDEDAALYFPWLFLRDHLKYCAGFVRQDVIEFTPPFLPTFILQAFARNVKRVYLSATITTQAEFTRVFGHAPEAVIAPNVDAGDGERLFLFNSKLDKDVIDPRFIRHIASTTKVLIAVPSKVRAQRWAEFAVLPEREEFTAKLDTFREVKNGAFVLAGRFDGIDLPGSQCRAMVIDGLPTGGNLIEQFLFERLQMDHFMSNTVCVRLTQLLGRIIRGRQDYGFFVVADQAVENWLKNERNRSLLPELLRRQLYLSEEVESQIQGAINRKLAMETMGKVLTRSEDWIEFYRDKIDDLDVSAARLKSNAEEDEKLTHSGKLEVRFMTKLWDNDILGAIQELEPAIKDIAIYDSSLAGWYAIWVGLAYYAEGKTDAAIDMFEDARHRIGRTLPLPRRRVAEMDEADPPKTFFDEALRRIATGSVGKVNDQIAKVRASTSDAFSPSASHKQAEESVRIIGSSLGFLSIRPCTEFGAGPDNVWIDAGSKKMIGFELKTDKGKDVQVNKDEVGQGLNHLEWLKKQYHELELIGLIYLTESSKASEKSSPADSMYFGSPSALQKLRDDFFGIVERIRPKTQMERYIEAKKISEFPEWSIDGIFKRLAEKKMR